MKHFKLTLSGMLLAIWISGCSTQPNLDGTKSQVDKNIPIIPTVRWIGDITAIALEWEPNHDPQIAGYAIYRRLKDVADSQYHRIAMIPDRFTSHYVDMNLPFQTKYLYTVSLITDAGTESLPSEEVSAITKPTLKSVVYFDSLDKLPRKAKLIWRPHMNGRVSGYVVERRIPEKTDWEEIATLDHRLVAEYIDRELDDNQVYLYRLRAVTYDHILSTPSDIVKIVTKALPVPLTNIKVSDNLAEKIELSWDKHPQKDISHYNIYRSSSPDSGFDLIKSIQTTSFTDDKKEHGAHFFYRISAVDPDGLESKVVGSFEGKTLPRPEKIKLRSATIEEDKVTLTWDKGDDRSVKFKVVKRESLGWFKNRVTDTELTQTTYETTQEPNIGTSYQIFAIDSHGIESEPIITDELIFKKVVQ